jgi:hypothetical protein
MDAPSASPGSPTHGYPVGGELGGRVGSPGTPEEEIDAPSSSAGLLSTVRVTASGTWGKWSNTAF